MYQGDQGHMSKKHRTSVTEDEHLLVVYLQLKGKLADHIVCALIFH